MFVTSIFIAELLARRLALQLNTVPQTVCALISFAHTVRPILAIRNAAPQSTVVLRTSSVKRELAFQNALAFMGKSVTYQRTTFAFHTSAELTRQST
jgi:hypothetical protein